MFIFSRFIVFRKIAIFITSSNVHRTLKNKDSIFDNIDINLIVSDLEKDGVSQGFCLPEIYVKQIVYYASVNDCYADRNPDRSFKYTLHKKAEKFYQKSIMRGEYLDIFTNCPAIYKIAKDPKIINIAAKYLKTKPVLMEARLWWNFVVDESKCDLKKGARTFHYDLDDYRCLVFFFYITDVDLESGPHVCVKGSHKRKKLKYLLSLNLNRSDREIVNYYGEENILTIQGKSGSGFAEDKFIYHKGTSPLKKNRLLLYVQFGINDYKFNVN